MLIFLKKRKICLENDRMSIHLSRKLLLFSRSKSLSLQGFHPGSQNLDPCPGSGSIDVLWGFPNNAGLAVPQTPAAGDLMPNRMKYRGAWH
jgi:hypothetical protein